MVAPPQKRRAATGMRKLRIPSNDEAAVVVLSKSDVVQHHLIIANAGEKHSQIPMVTGNG